MQARKRLQGFLPQNQMIYKTVHGQFQWLCSRAFVFISVFRSEFSAPTSIVKRRRRYTAGTAEANREALHNVAAHGKPINKVLINLCTVSIIAISAQQRIYIFYARFLLDSEKATRCVAGL